MRSQLLRFVFFILILAMSALGCVKKKAEPEPAATPTSEGEQAQAQGTAGTEKGPETQAAPAPTGDCTYTTDPKAIALQWTAYKFTEKTAVKGTFSTANVQGPATAKSLAALAQGLQMDIDGSSFESGDPGRNVTVKDFFFAKFNPPFKMAAVAKSLNGDDTQGTLMIEINMNGVAKEIPFSYTADAQGEIVAKAEIKLMDWQLKAAFDSIHQACEQLHTGKDGVSKTWDVVDLELKGKFTKACGPAPAAQGP